MSRHICKIRVRYVETDQMGNAHHSHFVNWLEVARTDCMRSIGYSYKSIEDLGIIIPVMDVSIQYRVPAYYDEEIQIETWLESHGKIKLRFAYELFKEVEGMKTLVARASTGLCCLDQETRKPKIMPDEIISKLAKISG